MALRSSTEVSSTGVYGDLSRINRKFHGNTNKAAGMFLFQRKLTIATTDIDNSDDSVYVFQFPKDCYLCDLSITITDVDTHATPAHVFNITATDGSSPTVLISGSTAGQTGTSDKLDAGVVTVPGLDVSGLYLMFDTTTAAATAAAGTLTVNCLVWLGDLSSVTGV